jgi:hypothetical protein
MEKDRYGNTSKPIKKIKKVVAPIITTTDLEIEEIDTSVSKNEVLVEEKEADETIEIDKPIEPTISLVEEKELPVKEIKEIKDKPQVKKKKRVHTPRHIIKQRSVISSIQHHEVPLGIVKFISAFVSLVAVVRTFGYDYQYYQTVDNKFFAILMSALLVSVSFTSPQVMIYAWKRRNVFIGVISLLFVVLSSYYSIFVTSEVIRMKRLDNNITQITEQENIIRARERVLDIDILEQQLLQDRDIELRERDSLQTASEQLIRERKDGTWEYNSMRTRLVTSKERIDSLNNRIGLLRNERTELKSIQGFYSEHVKTDDEKKIESSRDLIFAMFLDFVGPVFMSFSLFL